MGLGILFCVFALNTVPWGIQLFQSFSETTAADVAIAFPKTAKTIATCPHHPHGCPKECMCPKIYVTVGDTDHDEQEASGSLREPTLVTCTESGAQSLTSFHAVFLPATPPADLIFTSVSRFDFWKNNSLPNPLDEVPQKIPIV